jgi:hypothetical protein
MGQRQFHMVNGCRRGLLECADRGEPSRSCQVARTGSISPIELGTTLEDFAGLVSIAFVQTEITPSLFFGKSENLESPSLQDQPKKPPIGFIVLTQRLVDKK